MKDTASQVHKSLCGQNVTEADNSGDIPVFGNRMLDCPYVIRPSAYALVRSADSLIAVVRTNAGCFLPGGGIENGEEPERAVEREANEECGLVLTVTNLLGNAVEIVYSHQEHTCFEKASAFFEARLHTITSPTELGHELLWVTPAEAIALLSHASHRWAVKQYDTAA